MISWLLGYLDLIPWAIAGLGAVVATFFKMRGDRHKAKLRKLENDAETRRRIDNENWVETDADRARKRLRDAGK